ncbi:MAG: GNAT family N-acetyltransferase [Muribaculaceae bacterium]|nr:GNAT family N-acetyltransferase [Muribaculaceae bacterium]
MIRPATVADASSIADIYAPYVEETVISFETEAPSAEEMARRIAEISSHGPYIVWEQDGAILGYAYAHPWKERTAYCHTLETTVYLHPDAYGRGIGVALMRRLIDDCRERGFHVLVACITSENTRSIRFHESLGFVKASHFRQVGYKKDRWLDVVDLQLLLG